MSRSSTTTKSERRKAVLPSVSPGELLLEEFLIPMELSQYRLAPVLKRIKPWKGSAG